MKGMYKKLEFQGFFICDEGLLALSFDRVYPEYK